MGGKKISMVTKSLRLNCDEAVAEFAERTVSSARARVNVDTGNLRESIRQFKVGPKHRKIIVGAEYGAYHEYGTRHQPAQPFFHPAIGDNRRIFQQRMRKVFGN